MNEDQKQKNNNNNKKWPLTAVVKGEFLGVKGSAERIQTTAELDSDLSGLDSTETAPLSRVAVSDTRRPVRPARSWTIRIVFVCLKGT